jgi:hypothetical protein
VSLCVFRAPLQTVQFQNHKAFDKRSSKKADNGTYYLPAGTYTIKILMVEVLQKKLK